MAAYFLCSSRCWAMGYAAWLVLLVATSLQAQTVSYRPDPKEYYQYPNGCKNVLFFDNFDNNEQHWNLEVDGRWSIHKIVDSYYYLTSKDSIQDETSGRYVARELELNDSLDFEIEGGFRMAKFNSDTAMYGLLWGRNLCCEHNFNASINGRFSVAQFEFGWKYDRHPTEHKSVYYHNAYNRLTVRKVDSMCYYFVNKQLVYQSPFKELYGNRIGFWVSNGATVAADYLKIAYLPKLISLDTAKVPVFVAENAAPAPISPTVSPPLPIKTVPTMVAVPPPPANTVPTLAALPPPPPYQYRTAPDTLSKRKVIRGKQMRLHDTTVKLHLWDKDYEDGDRVAVYCNGKWITENCLLKNTRTTFQLHLDPDGDNYLVFCIVSEGSRPTNTVGMSIDDGVQERSLLVSSDKKTCESVKLVLPK